MAHAATEGVTFGIRNYFIEDSADSLELPGHLRAPSP
jgi:hypothetical protein